MALMSPLKYRFHLAKKALFGDDEILYEVLLHHKANLPNQNVDVAWERDGEYIVGQIKVGDDTFMTQGRSAKEFVEMVNDALYTVYEIPLLYAEKLGGNYRLVPPKAEFERLNNYAIKGSRLNFGHVEVLA